MAQIDVADTPLGSRPMPTRILREAQSMNTEIIDMTFTRIYIRGMKTATDKGFDLDLGKTKDLKVAVARAIRIMEEGQTECCMLVLLPQNNIRISLTPEKIVKVGHVTHGRGGDWDDPVKRDRLAMIHLESVMKIARLFGYETEIEEGSKWLTLKSVSMRRIAQELGVRGRCTIISGGPHVSGKNRWWKPCLDRGSEGEVIGLP